MIRNLLLLVCLCAWLPAAAHPYAVEQIENVQSADRTRFTSNPDGILSQAAVARIDSICYGLRQRGAAQVAVVAAIPSRSPTSSSRSGASAAARTATAWASCL